MIGIYKIENKVNGKLYIGQSIDIERRWRNHKSRLNSNKKTNDYLKNSWNKYGEENFEFAVICECKESELDELEIYYIKKFKSMHYENGYNITGGGGGIRGVKHSEEWKVAHSLKLRGNKAWNKGVPHSDITKEKMKKSANKGADSHMAKSVYCDGMLFDTIYDCANYYNVNHDTLRNWLKGVCGMPDEYIKLGLHIVGEEHEIKRKAKICKEVIVGDNVFKSITMFAKYYSVPKSQAKYWFKHCRFPEIFRGIEIYLDGVLVSC